MDKTRVESPWGSTFCDSISFGGPGRGYVTSTDHYPDYDLARGRAFAGFPPSSATVQVAGLVADARVEIEAVAFVPSEG